MQGVLGQPTTSKQPKSEGPLNLGVKRPRLVLGGKPLRRRDEELQREVELRATRRLADSGRRDPKHLAALIEPLSMVALKTSARRSFIGDHNLQSYSTKLLRLEAIRKFVFSGWALNRLSPIFGGKHGQGSHYGNMLVVPAGALERAGIPWNDRSACIGGHEAMLELRRICVATLAVSLGVIVGPARGAPEGVLRVAIGADPATFDHAFNDLPVGNAVDLAVLEGLFRLDPKNNVQKGLATDYTLSPDGKTFTVKIKTGKKFSNGDPSRKN
jgi:hypothetical protein